MSKNNKRISVKEYLDNKELLELRGYIPYHQKVNIVDSTLKQVCIAINGTYNLDSVLLDRIKMQIFIEQCTNLDLGIMFEDLDGYDLLKKEHCFDDILQKIKDEIKEFENILQLRISDFIRDKASVKGILSYKIESMRDYFNLKIPEVLDRIDKIDVKSITQNLSLVLDKIANKRKK